MIDTSTNTVYVVSKSVITSGPTFFQRLHALDLATGTEKTSMSSPSTISFSGFNAQTELQRAGLALANGVVYICWASHEDMQPYHGLVAGYSASNVSSLVATYNDTPNGSQGGIWMSGGAPAIEIVNGTNYLYVISGNGTFDTSGDYSDSFIKLKPSRQSVDSGRLVHSVQPSRPYGHRQRSWCWWSGDSGGLAARSPASRN